jgi:hypothetical protein
MSIAESIFSFTVENVWNSGVVIKTWERQSLRYGMKEGGQDSGWGGGGGGQEGEPVRTDETDHSPFRLFF